MDREFTCNLAYVTGLLKGLQKVFSERTVDPELLSDVVIVLKHEADPDVCSFDIGLPYYANA